MAVALSTKKKTGTSRRRRGQMPTKRVINLAGIGEKPVRVGLAIPLILLIVALAGVFSKFLVIDRLEEVAVAQREVSALQRKVDAGYEELAGFDDLAELYAHYTYSGFTQEELNRTDRVEVLQLLRSVVLPGAEVSNWSLSGNQLTINLRCETLQQVNLLVQQLEGHELVDYCTVNTANTNDVKQRDTDEAEYTSVSAHILAYLNAGTGVDNG